MTAAAVNVVTMGGALQALWGAAGSTLGALSVMGGAAGKLAQTVDNLASVAEETSASYLAESRANRKAKQLLLDRQYDALVASGSTVALTNTSEHNANGAASSTV